jgi:hypothetical protein
MTNQGHGRTSGFLGLTEDGVDTTVTFGPSLGTHSATGC